MANFVVNNAFNIGTDVSGTLADAYGDNFSLADLGNLMTINVTFDMQEIKIIPITNGGKPIYLSIPSGLTGSMEFTRVNGALTSLFTSLYDAFYNAGLLPHFSLSLNVLNRDGNVDEYLLPQLVLQRPDFGNFNRIEEVPQRLEFSGPTIVSVGTTPTILSAMNVAGAAGALTSAIVGI